MAIGDRLQRRRPGHGGDRHGDNRPCNSILCLDAATGETVWEFQISHHDVWDYDIPSQPNLITVQRDGLDIPAVSVVTSSRAIPPLVARPTW